MSQQDLMIKILTELQGGGIDQAKTKLDALKNSTDSTASAAGKTSAEMKRATDALQHASVGAQGFGQILHGNLIGGLNQLRTGLLGIAGALGAVAAAFAVGWKIGEVVRQNLIDPFLKAEPIIDRIGEKLRKTRHEMEALHKAMSQGERLSAVTEDAESRIDAIDKETTAARQLRDAEKQTAIARLEAQGPDSPDRQAAIADITRQTAEQDLAAEQVARERKQKILQETIATLGEDARYLEREMGQATSPADLEKKKKELQAIEQKIVELGRAMRSLQSEGKLPRGETVAAQYTAALSAADRARQEEDLKKRQEEQATLYAGKRKGLQTQIETAETESSLAQRRSEMFTPNPRLKGAAHAKEVARDKDLETQAAQSQKRVMELKQALAILELENQQMVEQLKNTANKIREQNKNLPID